MSLSRSEFALRAAVVIGLVLAVLIALTIREVLVLVFAGVVLAVALRSLARVLARHTPWGIRPAIGAVIVISLLLLGGLGLLIGSRMSAQFSQLVSTLQDAWRTVQHVLSESSFGRGVVSAVVGGSGHSVASVTQVASGFVGVLADVLLLIVTALFLALEPELYRRGLLCLAPSAARQDTGEVLQGIGHALTQWLKGVLVTMCAVAVMTSVGLFALGVPLALSLGILAGLFEFVPYVGPFASAVPAMLVAFSVSPTKLIEVIGLYLVVHAIEAYVLVPIIQKRAVALPPALGIFAVVIFGTLFGVPGVIFAHPLMVSIMVIVARMQGDCRTT